jgi:hypothetical protein
MGLDDSWNAVVGSAAHGISDDPPSQLERGELSFAVRSRTHCRCKFAPEAEGGITFIDDPAHQAVERSKVLFDEGDRLARRAARGGDRCLPGGLVRSGRFSLQDRVHLFSL